MMKIHFSLVIIYRKCLNNKKNYMSFDVNKALNDAREQKGAIQDSIDAIFNGMATEKRSIFSDDEQKKITGYEAELDQLNETIKSLEKRAASFSPVIDVPQGGSSAKSSIGLVDALRAKVGMSTLDTKQSGKLADDVLEQRRATGNLEVHADSIILQTEKRDDGFGIANTNHFVDQKGATPSPDRFGLHGIDTNQGQIMSYLFQNSLVGQLGFPQLTGLVGNWQQTFQDDAMIATFADENATATRKDSKYRHINMTPKRVTAYTVISKKQLAQDAIGAEAEIMRNINSSIEKAVDRAIFAEASGSPMTFGGFFPSDPTSITSDLWDGIVDMETDIKDDNYNGGLRYVTSAKGYGAMKKAVIGGNTIAKYLVDIGQQQVNGYNLISNNWIPNTLGATDDEYGLLLLDPSAFRMGSWGGLEIQVIRDDVNLALDGMIGIVVNAYVDFANVRAEAYQTRSFKEA